MRDTLGSDTPMIRAKMLLFNPEPIGGAQRCPGDDGRFVGSGMLRGIWRA